MALRRRPARPRQPEAQQGSVSLDDRESGRRRRHYGNTDGLADPSVHAIELAPDGTLWVGSDSGVYVYDPSTDMFLSVDD